MTYVKVNGVRYPATVRGRMKDADWDERESKEITLSMSHEEAAAIFRDGTAWSIVTVETVSVPQTDAEGRLLLDENGSALIATGESVREYDNSDYSVAGTITDHRDGTVTVKMGRATELETLLKLMYGGEDNV